MPDQTRIVSPTSTDGSVRTPAGEILTVPDDWVLVPPGDAALTRRIKAAGPSWVMQEKKGRRVFSRGTWAPASTVATIREQLDRERADPKHARKREADAARRDRKQAEYVEDFLAAVLDFLSFAPCYAELGTRLATAVTEHATPVGSGTVARTERIPIERRAESAVIAWMRHQTTAYDRMIIPRQKGERREVRRMLARRSHELLASYREGRDRATDCPLARALDYSDES